MRRRNVSGSGLCEEVFETGLSEGGVCEGGVHNERGVCEGVVFKGGVHNEGGSCTERGGEGRLSKG